MRNASMILVLAAWSVSVSAATFIGSTPAGKSVRDLFAISTDKDAPLEWELKLEDSGEFSLQCKYVFDKKASTAVKKGKWKDGLGTKSDSNAKVLELDGVVNFLRVSENVLHFLDSDRGLMVGNGGWSYSLYDLKAAEKPGDREIAMLREGLSYTNTPLSAGPKVFGIFEGRTPCNGIARAIGSPENVGCIKTKWRVTLFHDPASLKATTYKIDGSRYKGVPREGKWKIESGSDSAVAYVLEAAGKEGTMLLLKGDDNVLFFADAEKRPLVGHGEFGYTLYRRPADGFND